MLKSYFNCVKDLLRDDKGQGMVEYGLIIALIAVVVMAAIGPLGTAIASMFTTISGKF